ncbi:DEAD/DEAH box helicase [Leeuwenhoekiella aequorea]|uniref:DEAD/DEAH box helicase n=1 Tax=Leeuwenhoekiella aequorea TaxID=283736 RepID=UPI00352E66F9
MEQAQQGAIESLKLVSAVSLSVRNAFTLSPEIFDIVIVDEASQCDLASLLPVIYRAKRIVILGDPNQLPHITNITKSESDYVATKYDIGKYQVQFSSKSLFDFVDDLSKKSNFKSVMLNEHYRCHPEIIKWSNDHIYRTTLGQVMTIKTTPAQYDVVEKGFYWLDVKGEMDNEKNTNKYHALSTKNLYDRLRADNPTKSIGIITPFRGQRKLLQDIIGESDKLLKIDSVHKFQGDEKDIIIFNMVISSNSAQSKLNFVNRNSYILNVAITRARAALYIIGDFNALSAKGSPKTPVEKLAHYANDLSKVIDSKH